MACGSNELVNQAINESPSSSGACVNPAGYARMTRFSNPVVSLSEAPFQLRYIKGFFRVQGRRPLRMDRAGRVVRCNASHGGGQAENGIAMGDG
jgi:hypothetical protein